MVQVAIFFQEILYAVSLLVLISIGLAVIFGMMRVINLAHGEFMTLGGYVAITSYHAGVNIWVAMLVLAPLAAGLFGLAVERLIIRFLYAHLISTMLATWGLSLAMIGAFSMIFGNTTTGIASPIGGYTIGEYQVSGYNLFVMGVAATTVIGVWYALNRTRTGLSVRSTMQDAKTASAFGVNTSLVYMCTFTCGAALTGLAGGVLAPLLGLNPFSGAQYIAKAFITVISGGASVIAGMLASAGLFGATLQFFTFIASPVVGEIALLLVAVVLLRFLPLGISGRFFRGAN